MSGREIIAKAMYDAISATDDTAYVSAFEDSTGEHALGTTLDGSFDFMNAGDHFVRILAAAGWRLVAPGELDDETLERAAEHLLEVSQAMWDRAETKRPADGWERPPEGEKEDATTAWCFDKAATILRALKADRRALEGDGRG